MAYTLGWKDVLRPIRDGFRHLFPSPDTGPSPEERARQRALDQLKGFTYFDTFDQLDSWVEAGADPISRANTPLLPRAHAAYNVSSGKSKVLLCHDYAGNYHDYENTQSVGADVESYTCEYLQLVDTFIYFSHKLVCVPPPSVTNALHRNGVKAIGTILVEPQTKNNERLLEKSRPGPGAFVLAVKLGRIAKYYGFDGWLVNIEKPFPSQSWDDHALRSFLIQLKEELGRDKSLIWYDAITNSNKIDYQNALNNQNIDFAEACGQVLTNYCWKESDALNSMELANQRGLPLSNIFFGIDVWAQNKSKLTQPRITFPEKRGGGTNTGVAVQKLGELGLAAGIFAPAWTFEHFPRNSRQLDRAVWEGSPLPEGVECSCGDANARHTSNPECPIDRSAIDYPAGSDRFFYTDFSRGFARHESRESDILYDSKELHSQVAAQSVLPLLPASNGGDDHRERSLNECFHFLEDLVSRTQLVIQLQGYTALSDQSLHTIKELWHPIFKLNMPADGSLHFRTQARRVISTTNGMTVNLYLRYTYDTVLIDLPHGSDCSPVECSVQEKGATDETGRLQEIGLYVKMHSLSTEHIRLAEISEICILAHNCKTRDDAMSISMLRAGKQGEGEQNHIRLYWSYSCNAETAYRMRQHGMPYSNITGPFSYFCISLDALFLGRCYALEHVLNEKLAERLRGRTIEVVVKGIGFDGRELASTTGSLEF